MDNVTTFDTLKQAVGNQFTSTSIVDFLAPSVAMVEADINRRVRHRKMIQRSTAALSTRYLELPADFLAVHGLQLNESPVVRLQFVQPEELDALKHTYQTAGQPKVYSIVGPELEVLPAPNEEYEAELTYYKKVPALTDQATTNWLLTAHPDVYLYGTLWHVASYVSDKRGQMWLGLYDAAIEELILDDERARFPAGGIAMRARRAFT